MKALICSLIILCSVILSTILAASYTDVILSDFEEEIDARITHSPSESLLGIEAIGLTEEALGMALGYCESGNAHGDL